MVEPKFRAWKKTEDPEMFDDIAFINWNKGTIGVNYPISSRSTRLDIEKLSNVIVEQYTGINDRVGKEIYVNDLVSIELEMGSHTVLDEITLGMVEQWSDIDTVLTGQVKIWPSTGVVLTKVTVENPEQFVGDYRIPQWVHLTKHSLVVGNIHKGEQYGA